MNDELLDLIRLAAGELDLVRENPPDDIGLSAEEVAAATEWRDNLIRHAVNDGHPLQAVAGAAGVSHQTVARIAATSS